MRGDIFADAILEGRLSEGPITMNDYTLGVEDIDGGHRLIVLQGGQTQTADILDGEPGDDGYSPTVAVTSITGGHRVTVTDAAGAHAVDVMDGEPGDDGYSPTVTVTSITGGHRVTVTDAAGAHSADVMDGEKGDDGYSPTVAVTSIAGGHRVTVTDAAGPHAFDLLDGQDAAIDDTLTQAGQAADAKAAGDEIGELRDIVAALGLSVVNGKISVTYSGEAIE